VNAEFTFRGVRNADALSAPLFLLYLALFHGLFSTACPFVRAEFAY
jgi:hypothetical protein